MIIIPISPKEYPIIKGKDAEKFMQRHLKNLKILKEKVQKKLEEMKGASNYENY